MYPFDNFNYLIAQNKWDFSKFSKIDLLGICLHTQNLSLRFKDIADQKGAKNNTDNPKHSKCQILPSTSVFLNNFDDYSSCNTIFFSPFGFKMAHSASTII